MKEKFKKYWIWVVVAVALVIIGPIVINEAYKTGKGYITMWNAADVLSYYGMILAALGAAAGVFFSIKYSQKQYKEDKRRDVLPFFSINQLSQKKVDLFLKGLHEGLSYTSEHNAEELEGIEYKEFLPNKLYLFVETTGITFSTKIDENHQQKIEIDTEAFEAVTGFPAKDSALFIPCILQNVGKGCAVNTLFSIKSEKQNTIYSGTISIPMGEKIYFGLYFERSELLIGMYCVDICYQDIFGNVYVQSRMFSLEKHKEKDTLYIRSWTETEKPQMLIQEDTNHADT